MAKCVTLSIRAVALVVIVAVGACSRGEESAPVDALPSAAASAPETPETPVAVAPVVAPADWGALAPSTRGVLDDVRRAILDYPIDRHTIADLGMPDAFVDRLAVRLLRESMRTELHHIFRDPVARLETPDDPGIDAPGDVDPGVAALVRRPNWSETVVESRRALPEERPARRGFRIGRADLARLASGGPALPSRSPADELAQAELIAKRLAPDGLLATTARVLALQRDQGRPFNELTPDLLHALGLPVDLLDAFAWDGVPPGHATRLLERIDERLASSSIDVLLPELAAAHFVFSPSLPGFRVTTESGEHPIRVVRMQLTRGRYWKGPGAGGSLDVARQVAAALPGAALPVRVSDDRLVALSQLLATWPDDVVERMTIFASPLPVAQWAQDNSKPGRVGDAAATLVPRYASRREDGSVFIPGETYVSDTLTSISRVKASSLLFQGGNLLAVTNPADGERILLIGEAEIYRNTALGLTEAQVLEAFRIEFGVDRCVKLPGVSFHIDYDVTVRAVDGKLVAFVNDRDAGVRMILSAGLGALQSAGVLDENEAAAAQRALDAKRDQAFLDIVAPRVYGLRTPAGYPLSLAEHFAVSPVDSPVGNLHRFLAALDEIVAATASRPPTPQMAAYLDTFALTRADALAQRRILADLGMTIVPVPSFAEADRSVVTVNGVHTPDLYLMPAYGGLYAPLDDAARRVFRETLGTSVGVVPILTGESQRRSGAVHCSVSCYAGE